MLPAIGVRLESALSCKSFREFGDVETPIWSACDLDRPWFSEGCHLAGPDDARCEGILAQSDFFSPHSQRRLGLTFDTRSTYITSDRSLLIIVCVIVANLLNSLKSLLVLHPLRSTSAVGGAIFASHAKSPTTFARGTSTAFNLSMMADIASQSKAFLSASNVNRRVIHSVRIAGLACWMRAGDARRRCGCPFIYKAGVDLNLYQKRNQELQFCVSPFSEPVQKHSSTVHHYQSHK